MKKILVCGILIFFSVIAKAQTGNEWNLFPIFINDQPAGYIYQIYSVGTVYKNPREKKVTALRLVCSIRSKVSPIIAISWNGSKNETLIFPIEVSVDEKPVIFKNRNWAQDGVLISRPVDESHELLELMKTGRIISFTWNRDGVKKHTIFALDNFTSLLSDFNTVCKTQL